MAERRSGPAPGVRRSRRGTDPVRAPSDGANLRDRGATDIFRAEGEDDWKRHWKIRKQVPWVLRNLSTHTSIEDLAVPIGEVHSLVRRIRELEREYRLRIPTFGHLGDGNLHAHPLKEASSSEADWLETLPRLLTELYRSTAALGGTISGEHGIGNKRRAYLSLVMSPEQIDLMTRIKNALDPNGILNPGKIFPSD